MPTKKKEIVQPPSGKVKITVVKKLNRKDIFGDDLPVTLSTPPECDRLQVGQEFICEGAGCPPGFCPAAFLAIQTGVAVLTFGGNFPWVKEQGSDIWCCNDGSRPVIFKLERVER